MINWDSVQQNAGGNYKNYAADGDYDVKAEDVTVRKSSTGTNWLEITFAESDEYKFPKISHPLSFNNDSWRQWHFMNMLKELGITEDKAKAAIEQAEGKSSQDAKVSAYEQVFKRAVAKHPVIKIAVSTEEGTNGKAYARADFKNRNLAFGRDNNKPVQKETSIVDEGEEIKMDELPF